MDNQHTDKSITYHTLGLTCTKHANKRMKQRGIKFYWVKLVLEYGCEAYQKKKRTYTVALDKKGIKKLKRNSQSLTNLTKLRRLYLILSEDFVLITCAYR